MITISVIIPIYNGETYLEKCLTSIFNQTLKNIEIICIDDGSTDNTVKIIENFKLKYDKIKIISQKNQGSGKARNKGIENCEGKYIAFLDADDIFLDDFALEKMYNIAIKNDSDIVSANLQLITEKYKIKKSFRENPDNPKWKKYDIIKPNEYGIPQGFYKNIFKKDFLIKNCIKFPDLIRGQDPVFLAEVLVKTDQIYTVPLDLYGYNYSNEGGVNEKINNHKKKYSYLKHFKLTFDLLEKGGLFNSLERYKKHLFYFLVWKDNLYDTELYSIYDELFKDYEFDETNKEYIRFKILYSIHNLLNSNSENYFKEIKKEFKNIDLNELSWKDKFILKFYYKIFNEMKQKLNLIKKSESLNEFKIKYQEYLSNENT